MQPTNTKSSGYSIENRRYIGSKSRVLSHIFDSIPLQFRKGHFIDVFGGTGVVAAKALDYFQKVSINDFLFSNHAVYQGFFGRGKFSEKRLKEIAIRLNQLDEPEDRYFVEEFGNRYFSRHDALKISAIREELEALRNEINNREFNILLASLIYSTDRSARTVGHYETFLKSPKSRQNFSFELIRPFRAASVDIFQEDANKLARKLNGEVAYVDPPYNSRQYSRFYHLLETLTKWDRPRLQGIARKPPTENTSEYCKSTASIAFEDLINNLNVGVIVVSYNNTYESRSSSSRNKITLEQIKKILKSRGKVRSHSIRVNHFNAGKSNLPNHREYIFTCKTAD